MRNCFVPLCDFLCRDQPRRCMFHPPKNMYETWKAALPKQKKFRPTDKVCEHHFHESDVIRNFEQIVNGEVFRLKRGRPKLKPTAVPCLNLPSDDQIIPVSKRGRHPKSIKETKDLILTINKRNQSITKEKSPSLSPPTKKVKNLNDNTNSKKKDTKTEITECSIERFENPDEHIEDIYLDETLLQAQYDALYDDIFEVVLPNTLWGMHRDPNKKYIAVTYFDCELLKPTKIITFNNKGELKVILYDKLYTEELTTGMSYEILSSIVNEIDEMRICKNAKITNTAKSENIFNDKCLIKIDNIDIDDTSDTDLCDECRKLL